MNYLKSHVGVTVIAALAVIVLATCALMFVYSGKNTPQEKAEVVPPNPIASKTDLPVEQVPDKFPKDIPIEAGATITQNYNLTAVDGRFQATRTFETKKSLDDNYTIYENYLEAKGWKIDSAIDTPTYKRLLGTNGTSRLQIALSENSATKAKIVDITLTDVAEVHNGAPVEPTAEQ